MTLSPAFFKLCEQNLLEARQQGIQKDRRIIIAKLLQEKFASLD